MPDLTSKGNSNLPTRGLIILILAVSKLNSERGVNVMLVQAVLWRSENVKTNGNIEACLIVDTVSCSSVGGCVAFDSVRCLPRVADS